MELNGALDPLISYPVKRVVPFVTEISMWDDSLLRLVSILSVATKKIQFNIVVSGISPSNFFHP